MHIKQVMAYFAPAIGFLTPVSACFAYVSRSLCVAFRAATSASLGNFMFLLNVTLQQRGEHFYGGFICMCACVCLCVCFLNNCKVDANFI